MRRTFNRWRQTLGVLSLLSLPALAPSLCAADPGIHVEPESIHIGTFFGAPRVEISAGIPEGCDVVVEVLGRDIEEQLLRKGRHWDVWMNVGEIDIEGAPSLYFGMSSDPAAFSEMSPGPAFGYPVLRQRAFFIGDVAGLNDIEIFDEFVKLKESEGLYRIDPGKLDLSPSPGGPTIVRGAVAIPSRVPPGTYQVHLSVLRDGRIVESRSASFGVKLVSLPALLSDLARNHGALHGVLAVTVAIAFGYLTGATFRRRRPISKSNNRNESREQPKRGA